MARKINPPLALRIPQKILQDPELRDYFRETQFILFQLAQFIEQTNKFGSFYSTSTQSAAAPNTAYAITFNNTDLSAGVSIGTPTSRVTVDAPGVYNFQHSIQVINTSGGDHSLWIWFRKNGVDIAQSATELKVQKNNNEQFAAWNFYVPMDVNDYVELMWAVGDIAVQLIAVAASSPVPAVPSVILTVNYVGYEV
jgi:hypothetical protein